MIVYGVVNAFFFAFVCGMSLPLSVIIFFFVALALSLLVPFIFIPNNLCFLVFLILSVNFHDYECDKKACCACAER